MTRVVVVGDLMTDTVARAAFPLAKGGDTPASVTMHGGGPVPMWLRGSAPRMWTSHSWGVAVPTSRVATVTWNSWATASTPGW